jgi:outer membrane lipoprotein-sorting protein
MRDIAGLSRRTAVALLAGLAWVVAPAAPAEESAHDIARKSRERGSLNLMDLTAELRLVTTGKDGVAKEQQMVSSARRVGGRVRSLSRFTAPPGVAGVAVLTVEGEGKGTDEISLYLPKLKRVRKIAQAQRGESFMSTDFSYADLGGQGARDDAMVRGPDAVAEGRKCFVLKGNAGEASPYREVTLFVDQETYVPMRVEYRDKDGALVKVFRTLKLKRFQDRTLAAESVMENQATGSKTALSVLKLEPSRLGDDDFTERALERG